MLMTPDRQDLLVIPNDQLKIILCTKQGELIAPPAFLFYF